MYTREELNFAYRYPFSNEARELIKGLGLREIDHKYMVIGKARVEEALLNDRIEYRESDYGKLDFVVAYVYARMLVSALKNIGTISRYANAEARRAMEALARGSDSDIMTIATELGLALKQGDGGFTLRFAQFLDNSPNEDGFGLANQRLSNGVVALDRFQAIKVTGVAIARSIAKGLPIKSSEIPKTVIEYSKGISVPIPKTHATASGGKINWIDRLLQTPIPDCRHRTVNLILAPYLVNTKGIPVEKALEVISGYIALCKTINPDTKITDRYIKYQCEYAKSHGLRPLSLARAKTELGSGIDFNILLGEETEKAGK